MRIWSVDDGPDEQALTALEAKDLGSLKRLIPEPAEVRGKYWDHAWRREHRGHGRLVKADQAAELRKSAGVSP